MIQAKSQIKIKFFEYFEYCNYLDPIFRMFNKENTIGTLKNILNDIFKEDIVQCDKFMKAKSLEELYFALPNKVLMKMKIKLYKFELISKQQRVISNYSSVYAIRIPMGGQNKF